ncbi:hypothetical protein [Nitrosomonas halophila]|uniref:hypothetical protein n=1 Tax=Nitrosomonas halophila TaxID=44576 RepID=UPI000B887FEE|nr:hypothetical protein [Nitrosomonas halophila]
MRRSRLLDRQGASETASGKVACADPLYSNGIVQETHPGCCGMVHECTLGNLPCQSLPGALAHRDAM